MSTCPHCSSDQYSVNVTCANCGVIYKALPNWVGLTPDEFKFIASKYLLSREAGLEYFQEEVETKLKQKNGYAKENT